MIKLSEISSDAPEGATKKDYKKRTQALAKHIADLQYLMNAEKKHSLLIIFQGMDASGKDGASGNVFEYASPIGVNAYSFKKPTDEEFAHDFLWRVHKRAPQKGEIAIFNRSHYEDILIQRVHGWIDEDRVKARMKAINAFEELLVADNNTTVLKFYMHISQERQKEKLQERIDEPRKNWKHNDNDWKESKHWDKYMDCYEYAINNSSIPWHIIPVDQRWYRDFSIAKIVAETLESFEMQFPKLEK